MGKVYISRNLTKSSSRIDSFGNILDEKGDIKEQRSEKKDAPKVKKTSVRLNGDGSVTPQ